MHVSSSPILSPLSLPPPSEKSKESSPKITEIVKKRPKIIKEPDPIPTTKIKKESKKSPLHFLFFAAVSAVALYYVKDSLLQNPTVTSTQPSFSPANSPNTTHQEISTFTEKTFTVTHSQNATIPDSNNSVPFWKTISVTPIKTPVNPPLLPDQVGILLKKNTSFSFTSTPFRETISVTPIKTPFKTTLLPGPVNTLFNKKNPFKMYFLPAPVDTLADTSETSPFFSFKENCLEENRTFPSPLALLGNQSYLLPIGTSTAFENLIVRKKNYNKINFTNQTNIKNFINKVIDCYFLRTIKILIFLSVVINYDKIKNNLIKNKKNNTDIKKINFKVENIKIIYKKIKETLEKLEETRIINEKSIINRIKGDRNIFIALFKKSLYTYAIFNFPFFVFNFLNKNKELLDFEKKDYLNISMAIGYSFFTLYKQTEKLFRSSCSIVSSINGCEINKINKQKLEETKKI